VVCFLKKRIDLMRTTPGIYFVMGPVSGGGPRNVFTLSKLLRDSGRASSILSFRSHNLRNRILGKKTSRNYFGSERLEPSIVPSLLSEVIPGTNNVNYLNYPFFLIHQNLLDPLILFRYSTPDVYIATNWQSFRPTNRVSTDKKRPMMYFVQADETEFDSNKIYKRNAAKTYINDVPKFTQSKWLIDLLKRKFDADLEYIGLGIDHNVFYPRSEAYANVIFTIARTEPTKGFPVFVRALNTLWEKRKDFKVVIAGTINALKDEDLRFPYDFLGWIHSDETLANLYSTTIFVNTGVNEALPMPPLEAMACGGTVIMTNGGGATEYVNDNKNCFVTEVGNYHDLYRKLDFVLSSPESRRELRKGAIMTARKYNWLDVIKKFSLLLEKEAGLE